MCRTPAFYGVLALLFWSRSSNQRQTNFCSRKDRSLQQHHVITRTHSIALLHLLSAKVIGYFGGHSVASKLTAETRVMLLSVMLNSTYCIQAMFMLPGIFLTLQDSNDVLIFSYLSMSLVSLGDSLTNLIAILKARDFKVVSSASTLELEM